MRIVGFVSLFFVTLALSGCRRSFPELDQDQRSAIAQEVEATVGQLFEAMNAHDPDRVLSFFRHSDDFVYLGCTEFMIGFDTFSARVGMYYSAHPEMTFHQEVVLTQVLSPTVAVVASRGGTSEAEALFWTDVLTRGDDGRWVISYEHESWPGCPPPSGPHPFTSGSEMPGTGVGPDTAGGGSGGQ